MMSRDPQIANFHPADAVDLTSVQKLSDKRLVGSRNVNKAYRNSYMDGFYDIDVADVGNEAVFTDGCTYNSTINFYWNDGIVYNFNSLLGTDKTLEVKLLLSNITQGTARPLTFWFDSNPQPVRWLGNNTAMTNTVPWVWNLWTFNIWNDGGSLTVLGKRETYGG